MNRKKLFWWCFGITIPFLFAFIYIDSDSIGFKTTTVGKTIYFSPDNEVLNLTLSGASDYELATFEGTAYVTDFIELGHPTDTTIARSGAGAITIEGAALAILNGGLQDLDTLGAAASDGQFVVATGAGALAWESGATVRTSVGVGTGDSPQLTGIELSHATENTLTGSLGVLSVEGKVVYSVDGNDVDVVDGGTGVSTLADGGLVIGNGGNDVEVVAAGTALQILVGGGASTAPVWGTDIPTAVTIGSAAITRVGGTDVTVADGGTGRSTSTTAYGLLAAGTTATGAHQTLAAGLATEMLVGAGASALPAWTTVTGTAAPVRATSPSLTTPAIAGATLTGVLDAGGATLEIPNSTDPDITLVGQLSLDSNGAKAFEPNDVIVRAFGDGDQWPVGQKIKTIQALYPSPNSYADGVRDASFMWHNTTGMKFYIVEIKAWSDDVTAAFSLNAVSAADWDTTATVDAVLTETAAGTDRYADTETTITHGEIDHDEILVVDFDDVADPNFVAISVSGWFDANID